MTYFKPLLRNVVKWSDTLLKILQQMTTACSCVQKTDKFTTTIHDTINYSTSICPFVSGKRGKAENYKNFNISRTKRAF